MSEENIPQLEEVSEPEPAFDVGNAEHVEKRKRKIKVDSNGANSAIRGVMGCPEGRAFFWWLLGECGVHRSSFSTNGLTMAFTEGGRNIGLKIEARLVEVCPDDFMQMTKEAREKDDA